MPLNMIPGHAISFPILAVVTDSNPNLAGFLSDLPVGSINVSWGDGGSNTLGDGNVFVTQFGAPPGDVVYVQGDHTYMTPGDFQVRVTITDVGGSATFALTEAIITAGPPPPPMLVPANVLRGIAGNKLDPVAASFTVAEPDATTADFAATIDWGDGSETDDGVITLIGGTDTQTNFQVTGDHIYAEAGSYSVVVTLTTLGSNAQSVTTPAEVANAPITVIGGTADLPEAVTGDQVVGTFTYGNLTAPPANFTATLEPGSSLMSFSSVSITQPGGAGNPYVATAIDLEGDDSGLGNEEQDGSGFVLVVTSIAGSVGKARVSSTGSTRF